MINLINPEKMCGYDGCNKIHKTTRRLCPDCRAGTVLTMKETNESTLHVVYTHVSEDGEIMYIGEGTPARAYMYRGSAADRDPKHSLWFHDQITSRYPTEVVQFIENGLTKAEAKLKEKEAIEKYNPMFNKL